MEAMVAIVAGVIVCLALLFLVALLWGLFFPWMKAFMSGGQVSIFAILGMRLRGTPVSLVLDTYLSFVQKGLPVTLRLVESTYIAQRHRIQSSGDLIRFVEEALPAGK